MTTKVKVKPRPPVVVPAVEPTPAVAFAQCVTIGDHLTCIRSLSRKIQEHVRFVATLRNMQGSSTESREKAVAGFHERLLALERALERVLDELRLG